MMRETQGEQGSTASSQGCGQTIDDLAFEEEVGNLARIEKSIGKVVERRQRRVKALEEDVYGYRPADIESRSNRMSSSSDLRSGKSQLEELHRIAAEPYFAHVDLRDDGDDVHQLFIGAKAVCADGKQIVVDWRSEMGSVYYNKQTTKPKVRGREYALLLRRAVSVKDAVIRHVQTEYDASSSELEGEVVDSFLLSVLRDKRRDYQLSDIIKTIQQNQNEIMRQPPRESFLVQGCAGSGKTMVMLHRLSYLVFNEKRVDFSRYVVVTPSSTFSKQVESLSRDLGIEKMSRLTVEELYAFFIKRMSFGDTYTEPSSSGEPKARYKIVVPDAVELAEDVLGDKLLRELYSVEFINRVMKIPEECLAEAQEESFRLGLDGTFSNLGLEKPSAVSSPYLLFALLDRGTKIVQRQNIEVKRELEEARGQFKKSEEALAGEQQHVADVAVELEPALGVVRTCALQAIERCTAEEEELEKRKRDAAERLDSAVANLISRRKEFSASKNRSDELKAKMRPCFSPKISPSAKERVLTGPCQEEGELAEAVRQREKELSAASKALKSARLDKVLQLDIDATTRLTEARVLHEACSSRLRGFQAKRETHTLKEQGLCEELSLTEKEIEAVGEILPSSVGELEDLLDEGDVPQSILQSCDTPLVELRASRRRLSDLGLFSFGVKRALRERIAFQENELMEAARQACLSYCEELAARRDSVSAQLEAVRSEGLVMDESCNELLREVQSVQDELERLESRHASLKRFEADIGSAADTSLLDEIDSLLAGESEKVSRAEHALREAEDALSLFVGKRKAHAGDLARALNGIVFKEANARLEQASGELGERRDLLREAKNEVSSASEAVEELGAQSEALQTRAQQYLEIVELCDREPYPEIHSRGDEPGELKAAILQYRAACEALGSRKLELLRTSSQRLAYLAERVEGFASNVKRLEVEVTSLETNEVCDAIAGLANSLDVRRCNERLVDLVNDVYKKHGLEFAPQNRYRHALVAALALCTAYYGRRGLNIDCLCIDEAQDLSMGEYGVIHRLLGDGVAINLYGDINQLVRGHRGIANWDELGALFSLKRYELKENYRNTLQVTNYCNERFDLEITGVGLEGPEVRTPHISDAVQALFTYRAVNDGARLAIIHKRGLAGLREYFGDFLGKDASWGEVDFSKISIIDVETSKGLEFDSVVVIDNLMERNELYIASTRSLDELQVSHIYGLDSMESVSMISAGLDAVPSLEMSEEARGNSNGSLTQKEDNVPSKGQEHSDSVAKDADNAPSEDQFESLFEDYEYTLLNVEDD